MIPGASSTAAALENHVPETQARTTAPLSGASEASEVTVATGPALTTKDTPDDQATSASHAGSTSSTGVPSASPPATANISGAASGNPRASGTGQGSSGTDGVTHNNTRGSASTGNADAQNRSTAKATRAEQHTASTRSSRGSHSGGKSRRRRKH